MANNPKYVKRIEKLMNILEKKHKINITELSKIFKVSEMTIYNDINKIKNDFNIIISKKEVIYTGDRLYDYSHFMRINKNREDKIVIAQKVTDYIVDYDTIFLDGSTTCHYLSKELIKGKHKNLTILTISPIIALELAKNMNFEIFCNGGLLNKTHYIFTEEMNSIFDKVNISKAFISCVGINENKGFTELNKEEAAFKVELKNYCNNINILIDHSKFGRIGTYSFGTINYAKKIFTDNNVSEKDLSPYCRYEIEII